MMPGWFSRAIIHFYNKNSQDGIMLNANLRRLLVTHRGIALVRNCALLSVLLALGLTPVSGASVLVNSSFETGSLTPWASTGGINASALSTAHATDGSYVALIAFTSDLATGTLSQTFNLASDASVDYAFWIGRSESACGCNDVPLTFTARIDGVILSTTLPAFETTGSASPLAMTLTSNYSGSLALLAGVHELAFDFSRGSTLFGRAAYFELDGVSLSEQAIGTVSAVPLPAALPLFATGLGVMGVLARRKRKTAAAA
jgi:hypothetical protein